MRIINKLYKGDVKIEFDSFKHQYWRGDDLVLSVTQALNVINKPALVNWAANMAVEHIAEQLEPDTSYSVTQLHSILQAGKQAHWRKKTDAGKTGSIVHEWIDKYIQGKTTDIPKPDEIREPIESFLEWEKEHKVKFHLSEQVVYSKKYNYVGTADFICSIDGKLYLGDNKTTKNIYVEHMIQSAAYRYAREEEFPKEKYAGQIILQLKGDDFNAKVIDDDGWYMDMFSAFLYALNLKRKLDKLDNFEMGTL